MQAFPIYDSRLEGRIYCAEVGMTLRDYFAAKAIPSSIKALHDPASPVNWEADDEVSPHSDLVLAANYAYLMADAMLAARKEAA